MRKLIFQQWLSMDGYAADADDSPKFLESTTLNKYSDVEQLRFLDGIDAILLGANTYRLFYEFWPGATNDLEVIADRLNSLPKYIFSKRLSAAPWGKWPAATIIREDAVSAVQKMKATQGKDIVLWGSISLAQSLIRADVIEEYQFRICPVVLGKGRPMFENMAEMNFELNATRPYDSGLLYVSYRRKASAL